MCGFDFSTVYGERGQGYIECHHVVPLHETGEGTKKLADLALICSNCPRMIHRCAPGPTPAGLRWCRSRPGQWQRRCQATAGGGRHAPLCHLRDVQHAFPSRPPHPAVGIRHGQTDNRWRSGPLSRSGPPGWQNSLGVVPTRFPNCPRGRTGPFRRGARTAVNVGGRRRTGQRTGQRAAWIRPGQCMAGRLRPVPVVGACR
ncbi:HNH endonuclease [Streptomyces spiralis]